MILKIIPYLKTVIKNFLPTRKRKIVGDNNIIYNEGSFKNVIIDIAGENNKITVGQHSHITNVTFFIRGDNHSVDIGQNCFVSGGSFWFEDDNCKIIIGSKTTVESAHFAAVESYSVINIGEDCMLATNIEIRTSDSHSIIDSNTMKRINDPGNVIIGNHVWIAASVSILKGVSIGNNSIVGTGSVVSRNIPSGVIAVGMPARVVKENVTWCRERLKVNHFD